MKPLAWVEQEGIHEADANGFRYRLTDWFGEGFRLNIYFEDACTDDTEIEKLATHKETCQTHANAVQAAIDAACAKERENADRLAKALGAAKSGLIQLTTGNALAHWYINEVNEADKALAAHKEARQKEAKPTKLQGE